MAEFEELMRLIEYVLGDSKGKGHFGTPGQDTLICYGVGAQQTPISWPNLLPLIEEGQRQEWIKETGGCGHLVTVSGKNQLRLFKKYTSTTLNATPESGNESPQLSQLKIFLLNELKERVPYVKTTWAKQELNAFAIAQIGKIEDQCKFILDALSREELAELTKSQLEESKLIRRWTAGLAVVTFILAVVTGWMAKSTADLAEQDKATQGNSVSELDGRIKLLEARLEQKSSQHPAKAANNIDAKQSVLMNKPSRVQVPSLKQHQK